MPLACTPVTAKAVARSATLTNRIVFMEMFPLFGGAARRRLDANRPSVARIARDVNARRVTFSA
jgi:hypothetical protein